MCGREGGRPRGFLSYDLSLSSLRRFSPLPLFIETPERHVGRTLLVSPGQRLELGILFFFFCFGNECKDLFSVGV